MTKIEKLENLLGALIGDGCASASDFDEKTRCFFCKMTMYEGLDHDDNCPYIKARKLLDLDDGN